jgi:hypothetical protein
MDDIHELQQAVRALQPIMLPASRGLGWAISGVFGFMLLLTFVALPFKPIVGSLGILFFGSLLYLVLLSLRPGATYLALDRDGVTQCVFFRPKTIRWFDVTEISSGWLWSDSLEISWNRRIFVHYHRDNRDDAMILFPRQFGIDADLAMSLLTSYQLRSQCERGAPSDKSAAATAA